MDPKKHRIAKININQLMLFFILYIISSISCYGQTTESDLLVDDDSSFGYYEIIEQRNFFRPKKDLKKVEKGSEEKKQKKERDGLDFILTGVIEIKSGYKAIVEKKSSKKGFYVSIGEAIEDYTVTKIMINKIILEKDSQEFELKLQQGSQQRSQDTKVKKAEAAKQTETTEPQPNKQTLRSNTAQQIRSGTRGKR